MTRREVKSHLRENIKVATSYLAMVNHVPDWVEGGEVSISHRLFRLQMATRHLAHADQLLEWLEKN